MNSRRLMRFRGIAPYILCNGLELRQLLPCRICLLTVGGVELLQMLR